MPTTEVHPGRADSARNRAKILSVARTVLETEPDATMRSIAQGAGVGQGTLYRHFPTREDLVLEVHRRDVGALVAAAPELAESLSPREALRRWLDQLADYGRVKRGLLDVMYAGPHEQLSKEGRQPIVDAIELLLEAGMRQGVIRRDVTGEDVLSLVGFLWRSPASKTNEEDTCRLLDIVEAGLAIVD